MPVPGATTHVAWAGAAGAPSMPSSHPTANGVEVIPPLTPVRRHAPVKIPRTRPLAIGYTRQVHIVWASLSADWAGVIVTAAGGLVALALLIFEIRLAHFERRLRKEAETKASRDFSLERARRIVAWLEPIMWEIERQGVVTRQAGGWKLVVSNDTDDTISNWRATVIEPDQVGVDHVLLEAAVVDHGVIPPRSRFEADLISNEAPSEPPPSHNDLSAIVALWWVDREANSWHSRGAAGPLSIPANEGRWSVRHRLQAARPGGIRIVQRQGFSATRLN